MKGKVRSTPQRLNGEGSILAGPSPAPFCCYQKQYWLVHGLFVSPLIPQCLRVWACSHCFVAKSLVCGRTIPGTKHLIDEQFITYPCSRSPLQSGFCVLGCIYSVLFFCILWKWTYAELFFLCSFLVDLAYLLHSATVLTSIRWIQAVPFGLFL